MHDHLEEKFGRMGAAAKVVDRNAGGRFEMFVDGHDRFVLMVPEDVDVLVPDLRRNLRHLLLVTREPHTILHRPPTVTHYLCGHDERHWFASTLTGEVTDVRSAQRALIPTELRHLPIKPGDLSKHKTAYWVRQGEWFFVPVRNFSIDSRQILRNENLQRDSRSKPHICEQMWRPSRGTDVFLARGQEFASRKLAQAAFSDLAENEITARVRASIVYVRGRVSHSDHETLLLTKWHQVYLNGEWFAGRGNGFLD